ncbi:conserved unknown protein [Ectocarpus siliculosus]|uniref:MACPF domain-containing protein n=1 Tax=Ectocarpus siliculosus TaxID=2880 RepID=D7FI45_ECTSI|nr:conserved unknown protein [Ectocarpus siliculosus]|eukprot:CBJ28671.1 conserved unknown protein [Ectocarpus siliculosus]
MPKDAKTTKKLQGAPISTVTTTTGDGDSKGGGGTASAATAAVLSGFSDAVAALRSSSPSPSSSPCAAPPRNEDDIAHVIGNLKIMHRACRDLGAPPTLQSAQLCSEMASLALTYLPEDTRKALRRSECGSDVAMELVCRNLTHLPVLAKKLYQATPKELGADEGLQNIHGALAPSLELYGALVSHGVDPRRRPWARRLLEKFASLSELRWVSWRRLMHSVDMGGDAMLGEEGGEQGGDGGGGGKGAENEEEEEEDEGSDGDDGEETPNAEEEASKENGHGAKALKETQERSKQEKALLSAAMAAAMPVVRTPPALSKGEVRVLETLYASGASAPPIRKQALEFGLGLDAAGQLEDEGILTSASLTESSISSFQARLKVPGKSEAGVKSTLMAMASNKSQRAKSSAPGDQKEEKEEEEDQFFGSYDTNEELVAAAGGGMALYGVNFFPNENDVTLKPYAPILKKPTFVEMAGASASFEASVLHSTEQSMASNFTKTTENGGISIAQSSSTSWGASTSVSSFGGAVGDDKNESKTSNAFSANNKKTTTSATMVETITCPMKSFRIPVSTMTMTEEALDHAMEVDTLLKAGQFLDTFGSHVSNGRHLLGGIFFRTMTMTTESEVDTSTLLSAASTQMQESRTESNDTGVSGSGPAVGVTASASATMKSASSSGVVKFHSTAGKNESESEDSRAMFQTYVRSMGPNVATPELFAEALFTDTSSWTVIDRGPMEALLPITSVLENMVDTFDPASPGKTKLENAMNLLTVAWQQRASAWKPLEKDPAVPASLRHMIGRSFATEDAHDKIRAAVVDLFEVLELELEANTEEAAERLSGAVLATAKEMETAPPGQADFFHALQSNMRAMPKLSGKFDFKTGTTQYEAAARSARQLSSTDWVGFDDIWNKRLGNIALKDALDHHRKFEEATLRLGEVVTITEPLVSVNEKYRLEIAGKTLRVVNADSGAVVDTLFEAEGTLGSNAHAHMQENGSFVLELRMITGFDRTETRVVLWTAPNTDSGKGGYARQVF